MTDETKKLCLFASSLFESERLSKDEIYYYVTNTNSRIKEISKTRQLVGFVLYNHYNYTMQMISNDFGLTNHSTVVYWMDRVMHEIKINKRMDYKYKYILDCIKGDIKPIKRMNSTYVSKYLLSQADKDYIRFNIEKGYSVSYISDTLKKTRKCIKDYLILLDRKTNTFKPKSFENVRVHSYNKRQTIDY